MPTPLTATTKTDLTTIGAIGAVSAGVMISAGGALQWVAGSVALIAPVLARRTLRAAPPPRRQAPRRPPAARRPRRTRLARLASP